MLIRVRCLHMQWTMQSDPCLLLVVPESGVSESSAADAAVRSEEYTQRNL